MVGQNTDTYLIGMKLDMDAFEMADYESQLEIQNS